MLIELNRIDKSFSVEMETENNFHNEVMTGYETLSKVVDNVIGTNQIKEKDVVFRILDSVDNLAEASVLGRSASEKSKIRKEEICPEYEIVLEENK